MEKEKDQKILQEIIDNTPVLIAYMDKNFNFIRVNKAYADADERKISFFPGKNHFELYPNEENEKIFREVVNSGKPFYIRGKPFEYPEHPERGVSYWDWSLIPIKNDKKKIKSLVLTLRDVTERELTKKQLEETNERLKFYKDLLAHDMKNILSVILSSTELVRKWQSDSTKSDNINLLIEQIMAEVQKGSSIISDIQRLSEIQKQDRAIKSIKLKKMIDQVILKIQSRFRENHIKIERDFPNKPVSVKGGELLYDAFENIIMNGIEHNNSSEKHIWIKVSKYKKKGTEFNKVEFIDNGIGIPKKDIDIFKRGVKRKNSNGMGIGLALVKAIVEGYGGYIKAKDRIKGDYTKGSNFIVILKKA